MTSRVVAKSARLGTLARKTSRFTQRGTYSFEGDMGMDVVRRRLTLIVALIFSASLLVPNPALAAGKQTLTGEVGDAMCGKKHMEGAPADCTHTCVTHG